MISLLKNFKKKSTKAKVGIIAFIVFMVVLVSYVLYSNFKPEPPAEYEMTKVAYGTVVDSLDVVGTVESGVTEDFVAIEGVTVEEVLVNVGDRVAKGDKLDLIIQKATEIGVHDITLVDSKRCVARYDSKDCKRKTERFSKIAESAAKQSGRAVVPCVFPPVDFKTAVKEAKGKKLFCYELEDSLTLKQTLRENDCDEISVFVGPEGGYTEDEAAFAKENGAYAVTLGKRILRCETAPLFVLSCLIYEYEL